MKRKRYNLSLKPEHEAIIETLAKKQGIKPTTLLTNIIANSLEIKPRKVGNPEMLTLKKVTE